MGGLPILLEHLVKLGDHGAILDHHTKFAAKIECRTVDIHRPHQCALFIGNDELGMKTKVFLFMHLRSRSAHDAQG